MANLKTIRRRIQSVQNTQKITRAMKMVAAAKLRRAQDRVTRFRSYADLTKTVLKEVARGSSQKAHPLLVQRKVENAIVLILSSDRGLCGAFNGNLCRDVLARITEAEKPPSLAIVGKKAADFFSRRPVTIGMRYKEVYSMSELDASRRIATELSEMFAGGSVDRIDLSYNEFVSVIKQQPAFRPLLPIVLKSDEVEVDSEEMSRRSKAQGNTVATSRRSARRRAPRRPAKPAETSAASARKAATGTSEGNSIGS